MNKAESLPRISVHILPEKGGLLRLAHCNQSVWDELKFTNLALASRGGVHIRTFLIQE